MKLFQTARPAVGAAVAALCLIASAPSHASDDPLLSVNATLHDFQYRLIDLDTSDGISPWIHFEEKPTAQLSLTENGKLLQSASTGGFVASPDPVGLHDASSSVSALVDGFTAHTQINLADLASLNAKQPASSFGRSAGVFYGKDPAFLLGFGYTLSPQTQVEFSFKYDLKSESHLGSLTGSDWVSGAGAPYQRLSGMGRARIMFFDDYVGPCDPGVFTLQTVSNKGVFSLQSDYDESDTEPDSWDDHNTLPFIYAASSGLVARVTNDGSDEMNSQFSIGMSVKAGVTATAVPEPGALSLALGGLALTGWTRRRKSRASRRHTPHC
ncbi:MAG: PEP-CTERM sorting domain-containing protein [Acidobacteriota bacterium]